MFYSAACRENVLAAQAVPFPRGLLMKHLCGKWIERPRYESADRKMSKTHWFCFATLVTRKFELANLKGISFGTCWMWFVYEAESTETSNKGRAQCAWGVDFSLCLCSFTRQWTARSRLPIGVNVGPGIDLLNDSWDWLQRPCDIYELRWLEH